MLNPTKSNSDISSLNIIKRFWNHFENRRKIQIKILIFIMLASGLFEIITIGSLLPFLSALTNSEKLLENNIGNKIYSVIGISDTNQLIILMTLVFVITVVSSTGIRLFNIWATGKLSASVGSDLSCKAYQNTLYQPYSYHIKKNSSDLVASLSIQINTAIAILQSTLTLISALIILICILTTLFIVDWKVAFILLGSFSLFYYFVRKIFSNKLENNSKEINQITKKQIKSLNEGFGSLKDTLLQNNQKVYVNSFKRRDFPLRILNAQNNLIANSPRYFIEAFGLCLIASIAYFFSKSNNFSDELIPKLGAIALGLQKLLPTSQIIYSSWALLKGDRDTFLSVLELLDLEYSQVGLHKKNSPLIFENLIFKNVFFKYSDSNGHVIKDLSFDIKKGERIGFIGTTGSGKTTTIDLLMTLLTPTRGSILLNGKEINKKKDKQLILNWRSSIAHVPQNVFLTDGSILENIAFGIPKNKIDINKAINCAKKARISDFIESLPNTYRTKVGERGAKLSGGQIQRIAIARAFYNNASVLVLDEATSALDTKTEKGIIESIKNLNKNLTIIIIAHRISTVLNCSKIFELHNGSLVNVFTSKELAQKRLMETKMN